MESKIYHVKFKETKRGTGEDLYFCSENRKVYIRQSANVPDIVFWLSSSKWSGGYEASCPIREGISFVVEHDGVEYTETLVEDTWNSGTSAKKMLPFSWENKK